MYIVDHFNVYICCFIFSLNLHYVNNLLKGSGNFVSDSENIFWIQDLAHDAMIIINL